MADIFYALSGCSIKIFSKHEDPVVLSGYQFFTGGVILYVIGHFMGGTLVFYEPGFHTWVHESGYGNSVIGAVPG